MSALVMCLEEGYHPKRIERLFEGRISAYQIIFLRRLAEGMSTENLVNLLKQEDTDE